MGFLDVGIHHGVRKRGYYACLPSRVIILNISNRTDINQRTGSGKFKKVMWYRKRFGYGNDLVGQPVEPWKRGQEAEYVAFADRILPGNS